MNKKLVWENDKYQVEWRGATIYTAGLYEVRFPDGSRSRWVLFTKEDAWTIAEYHCRFGTDAPGHLTMTQVRQLIQDFDAKEAEVIVIPPNINDYKIVATNSIGYYDTVTPSGAKVGLSNTYHRAHALALYHCLKDAGWTGNLYGHFKRDGDTLYYDGIKVATVTRTGYFENFDFPRISVKTSLPERVPIYAAICAMKPPPSVKPGDKVTGTVTRVLGPDTFEVKRDPGH